MPGRSDDPADEADRLDWIRPAAGGCLLRVHVRPGATRPGLAGLHAGALCARVRARPVEGAANRELVTLLAEALGVPRGAVRVAGGAHGRSKQVRIEGVDAATARQRLGPFLFVDKGGTRG